MSRKVFISHASEDKERFVNEFATKLRANGIDAWLDKWEMLPGDSLVDKVFEEGLKNAEAVIIVLSKFSVDKPWVREELNASVVKRISNGTKIIPIVLDDCHVPESLISSVWEPIKDVNSYDASLKRIISSIFGVTDKPAIGAPPAHESSIFNEIGGLTKSDNLVLKRACEYLIDKHASHINPEELYGDGTEFGLSREDIKDSVEILENKGYLNVSRFFGNGKNTYSFHFRVSTYGFENYARVYIANYQEIISKVISAIVNDDLKANDSVSSKLSVPIAIVDHIFDLLEANSHVRLSKEISRRKQIYHTAASLRRLLQ